MDGQTVNEQAFMEELASLARFVEQTESLEQGLDTLAQLVARAMSCAHCSIMLINQDPESGENRLRVEAHYGRSLPTLDGPGLDEGLADHVASTGRPLLINDLHDSVYRALARQPRATGDDVISVPIRLEDQVIGVINVDSPEGRSSLGPEDLRMAGVLALVVGKSIHIHRLQGLLKTHFMRHALARASDENPAAFQGPLTGDPQRVLRIIAHTLYREMKQAGFARDHMLSLSSEIISRVGEDLAQGKRKSDPSESQGASHQEGLSEK